MSKLKKAIDMYQSNVIRLESAGKLNYANMNSKRMKCLFYT